MSSLQTAESAGTEGPAFSVQFSFSSWPHMPHFPAGTPLHKELRRTNTLFKTLSALKRFRILESVIHLHCLVVKFLVQFGSDATLFTAITVLIHY